MSEGTERPMLTQAQREQPLQGSISQNQGEPGRKSIFQSALDRLLKRGQRQDVPGARMEDLASALDEDRDEYEEPPQRPSERGESNKRSHVNYKRQSTPHDCGQTCLEMVGYPGHEMFPGQDITVGELIERPEFDLVAALPSRADEEKLDFNRYPHLVGFELPTAEGGTQYHATIRYGDVIYDPTLGIFTRGDYDRLLEGRARVIAVFVTPFNGQTVDPEYVRRHHVDLDEGQQEEIRNLDERSQALSTTVESLLPDVNGRPFNPEQDIQGYDLANARALLLGLAQRVAEDERDTLQTGHVHPNAKREFIDFAAVVKRAMSRGGTPVQGNYMPDALLGEPTGNQERVVDSEPGHAVEAGREMIVTGNLPAFPDINWEVAIARALTEYIRYGRANEETHYLRAAAEALADAQTLLPEEMVAFIRRITSTDPDRTSSPLSQELITLGDRSVIERGHGFWDALEHEITAWKEGRLGGGAETFFLEAILARRAIFPQKSEGIEEVSDETWGRLRDTFNERRGGDRRSWTSDDWEHFILVGSLMKKTSPDRWTRDFPLSEEDWKAMKLQLYRRRIEAQTPNSEGLDERGRNWPEKYFWILAAAMNDLAQGNEDPNSPAIDAPRN